jgi:hypothetical protein
MFWNFIESKSFGDYHRARKKRVAGIGDLIKKGDKDKAAKELDWAKKSIKKAFKQSCISGLHGAENFANMPSNKNQRSQVKRAKYLLGVIDDERNEKLKEKRALREFMKDKKPKKYTKKELARDILGYAELIDNSNGYYYKKKKNNGKKRNNRK